MNNLEVKVVKSTATENGNHLIKMVSEKSVTSGLLTVKSKHTYYAFSPTAIEADVVTVIDLDLFNVVVKDHTAEDGTQMKLNYLQTK
jgi:hypothetical protein